MTKFSTATSLLLLALASACAAEEVEINPIELWPGDNRPGDVGLDNDEIRDDPYIRKVHVPTVTPFLADPENATGAAVVVCPGGGYSVLANGHEGTDVVEWLNSIGIHAILLKYRLPYNEADAYRHPVPMQDAQRAVALTRAHADEWGLDPARIGILGFSAGGHLASTVATHFDEAPVTKVDEVDEISARPDFAILLYPVISMHPPAVHMGSRRNLLGESPSEELLNNLSNHLRVSEKTPPTFLVHSADDEAVPLENSLLFFNALREHGVATELHVFQTGGHGYGLGSAGRGEGWPEMAEQWMRNNGFLGGE